MKVNKKAVMYVLLFLLLLCLAFFPELVLAAEDAAENVPNPPISKFGAGLAMGLAVLGGGLGQGKAISSALDATGRNPSASGSLRITLVLGLAFVESLVIFTFVIARALQ